MPSDDHVHTFGFCMLEIASGARPLRVVKAIYKVKIKEPLTRMH